MAGAPRWPDADLALLAGVYDLQCTAKMNSFYYEQRLTQVQAISFWMEIAIAATASGSGLAALALFQTGVGHWAWQGLALIAAAVSIVRPIYAPGKKIEMFARQQQGYHTNYFNLKKLAFAIRQEGCVTAEHRRRYDTFFDRHVQLSTEDETPPKFRLVERAQQRAQKALPPEGFWYPALEPAKLPGGAEASPRAGVAGDTEEAAAPAGQGAQVAPPATPPPAAEPIRLRPGV